MWFSSVGSDTEQRLKGALDARIAEEQARQQAVHSSLSIPARSDSRTRSVAKRSDSPAKRSSRPPPQSRKTEGTIKEPEPFEFEPEFAIADDDSASRNSTPLPPQANREHSASYGSAKEAQKEEVGGTRSHDRSEADGFANDELPTDVRVKLRRLDKLESRYHGGWSWF